MQKESRNLVIGNLPPLWKEIRSSLCKLEGHLQNLDRTLIKIPLGFTASKIRIKIFTLKTQCCELKIMPKSFY